jgi:hypothetical protein
MGKHGLLLTSQDLQALAYSFEVKTDTGNFQHKTRLGAF